jgi:hypothetical protein
MAAKLWVRNMHTRTGGGHTQGLGAICTWGQGKEPTCAGRGYVLRP